jgi:hypothetical protein
MRKIILSIIVFTCLVKNHTAAQYWSALGNGIGHLITVQYSDGFVDGYDAPVTGPPVASMCVYKGELYVAGFFDFADGLANNIAKWNGTKWMPVGSGVYTVGGGGLDSWVNALLVYNDELYVGGRFTDAGSVEANNIAKWNGTEWSAVGTGLGSYGYSVGSLVVYNGELYAGGHFYNAGNVQVNNIAKWNGIEWSAVGTGISVYTDDYFSGSVSSLAVYNGFLYAGGSFDTAGTIPANNIAKWNGMEWSAIGTGLVLKVNDYGAFGYVSSLTIYNGALYAGGNFDTAGGIPANNIAKWNETNWAPLASGIDGYVSSLSAFNGNLIVGGFFDTVGTVAVNEIVKWDGINWSSLGKGMDNGVSCVTTLDGVLYAGGYFKTAGNIWANRVAKWTELCTSAPPQPVQIIEWGAACKNHYAGYYINPVTDASEFTWTIPPGWSGSSISNRITVLVGTNGGTISVTANNPCGSSNPQTIIVAPRDTVPSLLEPIIGNNSVCVNTAQTYSVNPVPAATNYMWILPSGWTGHSITNTITTTVGISGGEISVRARNGCSESKAQIFSVAINAPPQPGAITGSNSVINGQTVNYSINLVTGATSYTWTLSGGGTIVSGQNTNSIIVDWQTPGNYVVFVKANYSCGTSINQTLAVSVAVATGVINPGNSFEIKILPNPSPGEFYLKAKEVQNKVINVEVLNMAGQLVYRSGKKQGANDFTQLINLDKMPQGIYAIKIMVDDKVYVRSIVINN